MDIGSRIRVKDYGHQTGAEGVIVDFRSPFYLVDLDNWEPVDGPVPHWLFYHEEIEAV